MLATNSQWILKVKTEQERDRATDNYTSPRLISLSLLLPLIQHLLPQIFASAQYFPWPSTALPTNSYSFQMPEEPPFTFNQHPCGQKSFNALLTLLNSANSAISLIDSHHNSIHPFQKYATSQFQQSQSTMAIHLHFQFVFCSFHVIHLCNPSIPTKLNGPIHSVQVFFP